MALLLNSGPAVEPVTLAEAKAHLRVDGTDEDTLISSLITAARVHIETTLPRALVTQSWSYFLDAWPSNGALTLPLAPVQSVSEIKTYDQNDVATTYDATKYFADTVSDPGRILLRSLNVPPAAGRAGNGVEVLFTAGYGNLASDVPQPIRQALLLLVAHWFERREPVSLSQRAVPVPQMVATLLNPFRSVCW